MSVRIKRPVVTAVAIREDPKEATDMGEVRVRVTLTNAGDEALVRRGLMKPEQVRTYTADALVDTGAVMAVLPPHIVQLLGLATLGKARAEYANGAEETVDLTEAVTMEINGRSAIMQAMVLGSEAIIGQMVLEQMDYLVDCKNGRLMGNPAHPDQPVLKVK